MRINVAFRGLFAAALLVCFSGQAAAREVALVLDGEPAAVIVLPGAAGPRSAEQRAADLLATTIEAMSGARLEVKRERELGNVRAMGGRLVAAVETAPRQEALPGATRMGTEGVPGEGPPEARRPINYLLVGVGELARQLGADAEGLGVGGVRLKTVGNAVAVLGGPETAPDEMGQDANGVYYAAAELLERLGCRYLWPGPAGRVIPRRDTLAVGPLDYSYTPPIKRRHVRGPVGLGHRSRAEKGLNALGITDEEWREGHSKALGEGPLARWNLSRQAIAGLHAWPHAGGGLRDGERHLEENPGWFALQLHGTRDQSGDREFRLCKSSPELIAHVANDIIQRASENPNLTLVSLDPHDGGTQAGFCLCENCKALDPPQGAPIKLFAIGEKLGDGPRRRQLWIDHVSLTDRKLHYWNSIAERVVAVHPHMRFGVSVYSAWQHPPIRTRLHPNLVAYWVPTGTEHLQGWHDAGLRQLLYRPNVLLANWRDGKLRSLVRPLAEAMRGFADAGVVMTDFDSNVSHWSTLGLSYYAADRLNWNPYLAPEEIIEDYARHGFGAGAPHIAAYFNKIEDLTEQGVRRGFRTVEDRRYTPEAVAELRGLLNAAEEAAGDPEVSERIAFLRLGLNYTDLHETLEEMAVLAAPDSPRRGEVDADFARRLYDLHCLMLRDIALNHNLAINVVYVTTMSGRFHVFDNVVRLTPHAFRSLAPSDPALLDRVADPDYGLTGREQSLEEMLKAFGLD